MLSKSVAGICMVLASVLFSSNAVAMNKAALIEAIASKSGLSKADAKRALDGFIDATSGALEKGDRISLIGFGSFSISTRASRAGVDPHADKCVVVREIEFVAFPPFRASEYEQEGTADSAGRSSRAQPDGDGFDDRDLACPDFDVLGERDVIAMIADFADLSYAESAAALFAMQTVIIEVVNDGGEVDIEGFGLFFEEDEIEVSLVVVDSDGAERTEKELRLAGKNLSSGDLRQLSAVAMAIVGKGTGRNPQTGKEVQIPAKKTRTGRNPQTGKEIKIAAKNVVKFKAGADLSKSVN